MPYRRTVQIEFNHCDPAKIVFYPRFLEFANHVVENFFADVVGRSYRRIMDDGDGLPTVHLECDFRIPSSLGDKVELTLRVVAVGRASLDVNIEGRGEGEDALRFTINKRLVWIDGRAMKSAPWPDEVRARLIEAQKEDAA
ncbi:acyl-CoA thioesterase [Paracoccus sp. S-4012]|uniref:acyl-CoA thioesterase n=1 Tax=Paracoccus sp. S-4012 TaxID=2665648 RepID=UPI0012B0E5B4|nr:thioesterase family protein [Paracoccus sp. S-4012]MRX51001.1 acyl-CoA thioesterase [Paracoccus sp. S-4012]